MLHSIRWNPLFQSASSVSDLRHRRLRVNLAFIFALLPTAPFLLCRRGELPKTGRMNSETEDGPETSSRSTVWDWVLWPGVLLVLYVLSSGPVVMMANNKLIFDGGPADRILLIVYWPVEWACQKTPFHKPLGMYWHLWAPEWYDRKGNISEEPPKKTPK